MKAFMELMLMMIRLMKRQRLTVDINDMSTGYNSKALFYGKDIHLL